MTLGFIRPGRPVENAFAESFSGRLRGGCLDRNRYSCFKEVKERIESRRLHCNNKRPHS
ncbi:MAG: transposase [bacterium]